MHDSTANIFAVSPPVSISGGGVAAEKPGLRDASTSTNPQSFSSQLSQAESRQRSGVAEREVAEQKVSSANQKTEASEHNAESGRAHRSSETKKSAHEDSMVKKTAASANEPLNSDTKTVEESAVDLRSGEKTALSTIQGGLNEQQVQGVLPDRNVAQPDDTTLRSAAFLTENFDSEEIATESLVATESDTKSAIDVENGLPPVSAAVTPNSSEPVKATSFTSDSPLASSTRTNTSPVPTAANATEISQTLPAIDKRLGRLSATVEPLEVRQPGNAVVQGETKNSLKVDASAAGLRQSVLGLDGEKALNELRALPVGVKNSEQSVSLTSDLTLSKDALLHARDSQAVLATGALRGASPLATGEKGATEFDAIQNAASFNASSSRNDALALAATASSASEVKGPTSSFLSDHMLAASTSGIVTAPSQARVDLPVSANVGAPLHAPLNVPLLGNSGSEVLSGNIRWMVGEGIQNATVSVTPAGMGPITVQIGVEKDQMSISIIATQANTREALEATLPRLREQLGSQGLEGARVDISDGRSDQSKSNTGSERQAMGSGTGNPQGESSDSSNSDNFTAGFGSNNELDTGERVLSDTERDLLSRLQGHSGDPSIAQSTIRHGYDLYV